MTLDSRMTLHPAVHEARQRVTEARARLNDADTRLLVLERAKQLHEDEVARKTKDHPGAPIRTGAEAVAKGGSGYIVVYNPRIEPEQLAAARAALTDAQRQLEDAGETLHRVEDRHPAYDLIAEARKAGSPYYCAVSVLPLETGTVYQGEILTAATIRRLPAGKLDQLLRLRRIGQLPATYQTD
jgi:hypothetical protein